MQFFEKRFNRIACFSEALKSFVALNDTSIDLVSFKSGEVVGHIIPELLVGNVVSDEYKMFHFPPSSIFNLAALRFSQEKHSLYVWDLTSSLQLISRNLDVTQCLFVEYNILSIDILHRVKGVPVFEQFRRPCLKDDFTEHISRKTSLLNKVDMDSSINKFLSKRVSETAIVVVGVSTVHLVDTKCNQMVGKFFDKRDIFCIAETSIIKQVVAVGCLNGRIYILRKLSLNVENWVTTICHWHSQQVLSLHFDSFGTTLFSGGLENVLVIWPLKDTQSRYFLPRLPSNISNIHSQSESGDVFCFFSDNSFCRISKHSVIEEHCQLFAKEPVLTSDLNLHFPGNVKVFRNQVVANSHCGRMQFCDAQSGKLTMEVDISAFNYVSSTRNLSQWKIEAFDLNSNGYLCTLELCDMKDVKPVVLKFWHFSVDEFNLLQSVSAMKFKAEHPQIVAAPFSNDFLVLTDGVSLWSLKDSSFQVLKVLIPPTGPLPLNVDISSDGSLFMLCHPTHLQFWESKSLRHSVQMPLIDNPSKCFQAALGQVSLTSKHVLVAFEDKFEIYDLMGDKVHAEKISLTNVKAVESFPAFVAFSSELSSVVVIETKIDNLLSPVIYNTVKFKLNVCIKNAIPLMISKSEVSDSPAYEDNCTWMTDHSLVVVTERSDFLVLEPTQLDRPFSLLQTSDFADTAAHSKQRILSDDLFSSSVSDKIGAVELNKFVSHGLKDYSSHLMPKVDSLVDKILSFSVPGAKSACTNNKHRNEEVDSGIEAEQSDLELDSEVKPEHVEHCSRNDKREHLKLSLMLNVVSLEDFTFLNT